MPEISNLRATIGAQPLPARALADAIASRMRPNQQIVVQGAGTEDVIRKTLAYLRKQDMLAVGAFS